MHSIKNASAAAVYLHPISWSACESAFPPAYKVNQAAALHEHEVLQLRDFLWVNATSEMKPVMLRNHLLFWPVVKLLLSRVPWGDSKQLHQRSLAKLVAEPKKKLKIIRSALP